VILTGVFFIGSLVHAQTPTPNIDQLNKKLLNWANKKEP